MFSPTRPSAFSVTNAVSGRSRYCAFSGACNDLNSSAVIPSRFPLFRRSPRRAPKLARLNVLIHAEEIIGIVLLFDRDQPFVIAAVGFLHAFLAFVAHQEVYVCSARGKRMHRIVIALCPRNDFLLISRIRINTDHYLRPVGVAIIPCSIIFAYACCGAVDRIHMHGGMHRWKRFTEANVLRNCVVAYLIHKIGTPVPLQTGRIKRVEHALQGRLWQRPTKSSAGFLKARIGANVSSAFSCGPAYAHTTPHIFFMCRCSGNGGAGGTVRKAKKPVRSSGAVGMRSRYHFITSAVSLSS